MRQRELPGGLPPADVVVANLTGAMLLRIAEPLSRAVRPGGSLIVSGFLQEEQSAVLAALDGDRPGAAISREDEWVALAVKRA